MNVKPGHLGNESTPAHSLNRFQEGGKRAAFVANKRALVVWDFYYWYLSYLIFKVPKAQEGSEIYTAVIQSFRCLTVAVSSEDILENFSELFCWELSATWNHQNTVCYGLSGLCGEAAEKSSWKVSYFCLSVPSLTNAECVAQGLSHGCSLSWSCHGTWGNRICLHHCDGSVVQLLSLGCVRVKIIPKEKGVLKCVI